MFRATFRTANIASRRFMCTSAGQSNTAAAPKRTNIVLPLIFGTSTALVAAGFYLDYEIRRDENGAVAQWYEQSALKPIMLSVYDATVGQFEDVFLPHSEKLLPDWPTAPCYAALEIPPGTPAPPLLILDLERTLIGSEYDPKHGWRHVKRPGLDRFLAQLAQYYEVVIFSENDPAIMENVLMAVDKEGRAHKLGPSAGEQVDNEIIKRLDYMNRDIRRIILVDDNPKASGKFPRNTILVKPYTNVRDKDDKELLNLIPLLQGLCHDDTIVDFRDALDSLGTHVAEEAAVEYQMRVSAARDQEMGKRNRGLGKLVRGLGSVVVTPAKEEPKEKKMLTAAEIVGTVDDEDERDKVKVNTPVVKKKGALLEWLERDEEEKADMQNRKREEMERIYRAKMMEKMKGQNKE